MLGSSFAYSIAFCFSLSLSQREETRREAERKNEQKKITTLTVEGMEATALDWRLPFLLRLFIVLLSLSL